MFCYQKGVKAIVPGLCLKARPLGRVEGGTSLVGAKEVGVNMDYIINMGALDGGSPMSIVEFKKWLCQLFFYSHVNFQMLSCRMSYLRNGLCHVALSNLRVNGH